MDNFWPVFGVFYLPSTGDIFYAIAGREAYWGNTKINIRKQSAINDESVLLTYSRFHQHYRTTFPGKIRSLGCTAAHICYVAMGRADAAIIAHETYQDLAAASVIIEAAGGKIFKMDGSEFILNDYLNAEKIDKHLLVVAPEACQQILGYIRKNN
jgi:myo-inositol-1(or 4)-monophosphatase